MVSGPNYESQIKSYLGDKRGSQILKAQGKVGKIGLLDKDDNLVYYNVTSLSTTHGNINLKEHSINRKEWAETAQRVLLFLMKTGAITVLGEMRGDADRAEINTRQVSLYKGNGNKLSEHFVSTIPIPERKGTENIWCSAAQSLSKISDSIVGKQKREPQVNKVVAEAPRFQGYHFKKKPEVMVTGTTRRPANMFLDAMFGREVTTQPGSQQLYSFTESGDALRQEILQHQRDETVKFSAKGVVGRYSDGRQESGDVDLSELYGDKTFEMSYGEIQDMLESHKVYVSDYMPLRFYVAFKEALKADNTGDLLPGSKEDLILTIENLNTPNVKALVSEIKKNPSKYGFDNNEHLESFLSLTLYQMGSMVVKTEDYYPFVGEGGEILERKTGANDAIKLITACGIRGLKRPETSHHENDAGILKDTFKTALLAAEKDFVIFPAVGMDEKKVDPDLYWDAFLDAVIEAGDDLEAIFVNPNHQVSERGGMLSGLKNKLLPDLKGQEFKSRLEKFIKRHADEPSSLNNLKKIRNLYDEGTDLSILAQNLKKEFPDKTVSLLNSSYPDVTLGSDVGEYLNDYPQGSSGMEDNCAASGTSCTGFEDITQVLKDPKKIFKVRGDGLVYSLQRLNGS